MNVRTRRLIGLSATAIFLIFYIFLASSVGNLFLSKPLPIRLLFFAVAGLVWVLPLKPLFDWMRIKPHEIEEKENAPRVSNFRKK